MASSGVVLMFVCIESFFVDGCENDHSKTCQKILQL